MTALVLTLLYLSVCALLGFGLVLLAGKFTSRLVVAGPLLGIALAITVLHAQTMVGPVGGIGAFLPLVAVASILSVAGYFRARGHIRARVRRGLRSAWPIWLASAVAVVIVSLPSIVAGTNRVIMPSANHDAFYYVEVARWLALHPATLLPSMVSGPATASDSPAFGSAYSTLTVPLRYGQELFQAWLSGATGVDLLDAFTPWQSASVGLIGIAAGLVAFAVGAGRVGAASAALVTAVSFPVLNQTIAQNADSLLGIALALTTVGCVALSLRSRGRGGLPVFFAAVMLGATVGTYSEILIFLAPVLVVIVISARSLSVARRVLTGTAIVALSVVFSPFAWYRAAMSLLFMGSLSNASTGPMAISDAGERLIGSLKYLIDGSLPAGKIALIGVAVAIGAAMMAIIGLVGALADQRSRAIAIGLPLVGSALLVYLAYRGNAYMFSRASDLIVALSIPVLVVGIFGVPRMISRRGERRYIHGVASVLVVGLGTSFIAGSVGGFALPLRNFDRHRVVDGTFDEMAGWARQYGGSNGKSLAVTVPDFFDELWAVDRLRNLADVSYPFLRGDLGYLGTGYPQKYVDSPEPAEKFEIVGSGVDFSGPAGFVVHRNRRFALLQTNADDRFVIVGPGQPNGAWSYTTTDIRGAEETFASQGATLDIRVGTPVGSVEIDVSGVSGSSPVGLGVANVTPGWTATVTNGRIALRRDGGSPTRGSLMLTGLTEQSFVTSVRIV